MEAELLDLQYALSNGAITSVELVNRYLQRIWLYDARGPCLNSIPILNTDVFDEAFAADRRRAEGKSRGPLDGIPYTIKDSMLYAGMTCASGSPAFTGLTAQKDCFVASQLRNAGAICIGRTNTPPMMASGMHRGIYGRAESPYNLDYLTAAFSSGSSNGSATSTAASFAGFGLGSETVSSGRSPASNNGLVAYTPSRAVISPRGVWPLYPTCDVLVPHTRTVKDMLLLLDVLTREDPEVSGNFWLEQPFVKINKTKLPSSMTSLADEAEGVLRGKTVAVPKMFIGKHDAKAQPIVVSKDVIELWEQARKSLELLGATVIETDFPLVSNYDYDPATGLNNNVKGFPDDWNAIERGKLVAFSWDDWLAENGGEKYPGLSVVDGSEIFPRPADYLPDKYAETKNYMNYPGLVEIAKKRDRKIETIYTIPGMGEALCALEAQRKRDLDDWMDAQAIDLVVFPANGDVGKADLETNEDSAKDALQDGVKYSNGNRAIRHMGVPTVSVAMGIMEASRMPVNLTIAGKSGSDADLLQYAYAFEQATKKRVAPPLTPPLPSDEITALGSGIAFAPEDFEDQLQVVIERSEIDISGQSVNASGSVKGISEAEDVELEIYIDGKRLKQDAVNVSTEQRPIEWTAHGHFEAYAPKTPLYGGSGTVVDKVMVIVLARTRKTVAGRLVLVPQI